MTEGIKVNAHIGPFTLMKSVSFMNNNFWFDILSCIIRIILIAKEISKHIERIGQINFFDLN